MLNIVDADNPSFFAKSMINQALNFIEQQYSDGLNVLVHCNQGESRGPLIALIYMAARLQILPNESLEAAEQSFRNLYPYYNPKPGIRGHIKQYWQQYCNGQRRDGRT
jgi:protein-tyrosine phosphatase